MLNGRKRGRNMEGIKTYKELQLEKDIIHLRINQLKEQQRLLSKELRGPKDIAAIDYSKDRGTGIAPRPLEDVLVETMQIDSMIYLEEEKLKNTERTIKAIDDKLKNFEGLRYKVAYMREVEEKSLQEISDELNHEYGYIKNISMAINKSIEK